MNVIGKLCQLRQASQRVYRYARTGVCNADCCTETKDYFANYCITSESVA